MKFAHMKKGSSAGNTELAHKAMPFCAADRATDGNAIITRQPMLENAPASIKIVFLLVFIILHHIKNNGVLCLIVVLNLRPVHHFLDLISVFGDGSINLFEGILQIAEHIVEIDGIQLVHLILEVV